MRNLSLKGKLYAGFGIAVVVVAVLATYAIWSGIRNADSFVSYRSAALASASGMDASTAVLRMRLAAKQFRGGLNDDPIPVMDEQLDVLYAVVDDLKARGSDHAAEFESKLSLARSYRDVALRGRDLQREIDRLLVEELFPAGTNARSTLSDVHDRSVAESNLQAASLVAESLQRLLLARVYSNRFMTLGNETYLERASLELTALDRIIPNLAGTVTAPEQLVLIQNAQADITRYRAAVEEISDMVVEREAIYHHELQEIGNGIMLAAIDLSRSQRDIQGAIGPMLEASFLNQKLIAVGVGVLGVAVAAIFGFVLAGSISRPVLGLTHVMDRLRERDYTADVPDIHRQDELGAMARAVDVFKQSMIEGDRLRAEQEAEQAQRLERAEKIEVAINGFEDASQEVLASMLQAAQNMHGSSQSLSAAAEQTNAQSQAVAAASEQASANVQTVAGAAEELSASIGEIGQQVSQSAQMSREAVGAAQSTSVEVRSLAETADRIGEVVSLIRDIAEQTNLLALNATIEAARAGDAGKGFAVVATEVKALAAQTSKATEQISSQVEAIQSATSTSATSIQSITEKIESMDEATAAIAAAVEEQGSATQDIARSVQQVAEGTNEVSLNIHGVREAAEATGESSGTVLSSSEVVNGKAAVMRESIDSFLTAIRAA